jgi:opacity protein-like surface antigen
VAYSKEVAPIPPPLYGTGFYGAIDMGANVFQDRGGDRTLTNEFGDTLVIDPKNDVGFFRRNQTWLRLWHRRISSHEGDFFYSGFEGGADSTLTIDGVVLRNNSVTTFINSGAFIGNFIMRFAFDRFQPYVGAGVGVYFADPQVSTSALPGATLASAVRN